MELTPLYRESTYDDDALTFRNLVMENKWKEVIEKYKEDSKYHSLKIMGRGTALHVAINNENIEDVGSLVDEIVKVPDPGHCLKVLNDRGATPLHLAARRGLENVCQLLIGENGERKYLIEEENDKGETPLFWAVRARRTLVFIYLQQFFPTKIINAMDDNSTTILHVAIEIEMFELAKIIIYFYKDLISVQDHNGMLPLEFLATRRSAFFEKGSSLSWWQKIWYYGFTISHHVEETTKKLFPKSELSKENENAKKEKRSDSVIDIPLYYTVLELNKEYKKSNSPDFLPKWPVMSFLETIKTIKKKHTYGKLLLEKFMEYRTESYLGGGDDRLGDTGYDPFDGQSVQDFYNTQKLSGSTSMQDTKNVDGKDTTSLAEEEREMTAYLTAARYGSTDMMSVLCSKLNSVIDDTNSFNENALLLAVKYRQPRVIQWLKNKLDKGLFDHLTLQINTHENTMLHLAADKSSQRENTWGISGVAMQLMWDIKWYKYIKGLVPEHFPNIGNKNKQTPSEIFKEKHKDILKDGSDWMKETAESCSVVAALIAGVSFATSGSVPGGNQQTGEPTLKGQPAFEGFAISSLIGLYFSGIALIMFLSILTSRKEIEDFRVSLPMKLLVGLTSLFVSIVAMFVSFCAGHFFVLTDKYTKGGILFYLYISICLPVAIYGVVQFPLFIDLINVIWKTVPPPSVKGVRL